MPPMTWLQIIGERLELFRWCQICYKMRWFHIWHKGGTTGWIPPGEPIKPPDGEVVITRDEAAKISQEQFDEVAESIRQNEALKYAIQIIEAYELEIRNYPALKDTGFCQGVIFRNAIDAIKLKAKGN